MHTSATPKGSRKIPADIPFFLQLIHVGRETMLGGGPQHSNSRRQAQKNTDAQEIEPPTNANTPKQPRAY